MGSPAEGARGAAYVQLPPEGGRVSDTSPGAGYGVGNAVGSTTRIDTSSVGDLDAGDVTSTVVVLDGELLGGVVRARDIRVAAFAGSGPPSATVTFGSLIVAGIAYPDPWPNTRIEVSGVGGVVCGVRLQTTKPGLFDLPRGTDLILAHAAAGVPDVVATRPVAAGPPPPATPVPWAPISAYRPIDVALGGNDNDDADDFDLRNDNAASRNDNAGGAPSGTSSPSSS